MPQRKIIRAVCILYGVNTFEYRKLYSRVPVNKKNIYPSDGITDNRVQTNVFEGYSYFTIWRKGRKVMKDHFITNIYFLECYRSYLLLEQVIE